MPEREVTALDQMVKGKRVRLGSGEKVWTCTGVSISTAVIRTADNATRFLHSGDFGEGRIIEVLPDGS